MKKDEIIKLVNDCENELLDTFKYINKSSEGCILNGNKKSVDTLIVVLKSGTIYKMELTFFSKKQVDTILKLLKEKITNVTSNYSEGEL